MLKKQTKFFYCLFFCKIIKERTKERKKENRTIKAQDSKDIKHIFQNYCNLTLEDMTVDGTGSSVMQYVVSISVQSKET